MKKIITALTATAALATYGLADQAEASSYKVQSGDTLWKIANQNSVSVSQLKSWNNLSSDLIFINQNLKTSGSSSDSTSSSNSSSSNSSQSSSSSSNTSSSNTSGSYTVKAGDTLSSIARANGMNYRTLMSINNISSHIIHPGQKLSLGGNATSSSNNSSSNSSDKSESKTETESNTGNTSNNSSSTSTGSYSVKAGDTLSSIARAHGTTYTNIMSLNNLSSTIIYPGQSLKVSGNANTSTNTPNTSNSSNESNEASNSSNANASETKETVEQSVSAPAPTNVSYGKNYYTWGECTWYAFERRQQLGKPAGNGWGNAYNWNTAAKSEGYKVNNSPSVGAIMQADAWTNFAWGMGHVAVVERINADGSILVSEMNFGSGQGVKAFRTISASQVSGHNFIH
ncbi:LysM peptidoglycan-binding domain-containing protein [Salinicoccus sesuvii]|uniref:LysM peptidoglycan-binding domain-containing protein n=1 Tax=Salinicoccus sesuvii TaxID=868281 RepID=A0ABV7N7B6_9STAP